MFKYQKDGVLGFISEFKSNIESVPTWQIPTLDNPLRPPCEWGKPTLGH